MGNEEEVCVEEKLFQVLGSAGVETDMFNMSLMMYCN